MAACLPFAPAPLISPYPEACLNPVLCLVTLHPPTHARMTRATANQARCGLVKTWCSDTHPQGTWAGVNSIYIAQFGNEATVASTI